MSYSEDMMDKKVHVDSVVRSLAFCGRESRDWGGWGER